MSEPCRAPGKCIDEFFAFTIVDELGDEEVPTAVYISQRFPLVAPDMGRAKKMAEFAHELEQTQGKKVHLFRFTNKEEVDWKSL